MTPELEGCVFVSILTEELKVDEGSLSSSNNAQQLMETLIFSSRSKDLKGGADTIKGTICDTCLNITQHLNLVINVV